MSFSHFSKVGHVQNLKKKKHKIDLVLWLKIETFCLKSFSSKTKTIKKFNFDDNVLHDFSWIDKINLCSHHFTSNTENESEKYFLYCNVFRYLKCYWLSSPDFSRKNKRKIFVIKICLSYILHAILFVQKNIFSSSLHILRRVFSDVIQTFLTLYIKM